MVGIFFTFWYSVLFIIGAALWTASTQDHLVHTLDTPDFLVLGMLLGAWGLINLGFHIERKNGIFLIKKILEAEARPREPHSP